MIVLALDQSPSSPRIFLIYTKKNMELFKTKPRRSNGQFATREMAYADMQAKENKRLKYESEQWRQMYLAVVNDNVKMERELQSIKQALAKLQGSIH